MIKAIGFDYGGVIGGVGYIGENFTEQMCELLHMDRSAYNEAYFSMNHLIQTGEMESWHDFWKLFLEKIGQPDKYEPVIALSNGSNEHLTEIDTRLLDLVDNLRAKGYKTGLLSNTSIDFGKKMRELGVDRHFDVFLISAEIKIMKPDSAAFLRLSDDLGVQPSEMVFIDDAAKSLSTADSVGFTPVLYTTYENLKAQLASLGIA